MVVALLLGVVVPGLALVSGAVYLLFAVEKLAGLPVLSAVLGDVRAQWGTLLVDVGKWLAGGAVTITALGARFTTTFGKLRVALDAVLDVDNYLRDPRNHQPPRARIFSRYASLLAHLRRRGYERVVVAHSQGSVISADLLHYLHRDGRLSEVTGGLPMSMVTVGSPLRDLYAARFPLLYRWMGPSPTSFEGAVPTPRQLGLAEWVNAYRAGDYVGRALRTPEATTTAFDVARLDETSRTVASRADGRTEFCLGTGAHTHYFTVDAVTLAAEMDRLVAGVPPPPSAP